MNTANPAIAIYFIAATANSTRANSPIAQLTMNKLKMHSPDLTQANIDKLAALFPNCVAEAAGADDLPFV